MSAQAQQYTRGVGVYPGDPKEDFAAQVVPDTSQAYRILALHRAAYQSSSYDFNLTAQLATDGVKETKAPRWFVISTNEGLLTRQLREHAQDHNVTTNNQLNGSHAWMQFEFGGGDGPPEVDRVETSGMNVTASADQPAGWTMVVRGSDDGQTWAELGRTASADRLPAGRGFGGFGGGPPASPGAAGAAGGGRGSGAPGAAVTPGAPAATAPGGGFGGRGGGGFGGAPATLGYNLTAIRQLPKVKVEASTTTEQKGGRWFLTTELHNASSAPALMVRVKAVRSTSGDRILPAIYSDNYVALMPGEKRTIKTELENADTRGERPRVIIEGFNVEKPAAKPAAKPAPAE